MFYVTLNTAPSWYKTNGCEYLKTVGHRFSRRVKEKEKKWFTEEISRFGNSVTGNAKTTYLES